MTNYSNPPLELSEIPQFSDLEFKPMAKNYPILHCLETLFFWGIILSGLSVFIFFSEIPNLPVWPFIILSIIVLLSLILSFYSAKAMGYLLRDKDILYKQGVFWKKRTGVSFKRIQHIDITHGPLERKFQLASIKFYTAGGSLADLKISGLPKNDAEQIRSIILEKISLEKFDLDNMSSVNE